MGLLFYSVELATSSTDELLIVSLCSEWFSERQMTDYGPLSFDHPSARCSGDYNLSIT